MKRISLTMAVVAALASASAFADTAKKENTPAQDTYRDEGKSSDKTEHSSAWKDALLNIKVRSALLKNLKVDGLRVRVNATGDTVDLAGSVKDRATLKLAKEVAKSVEGVTTV